MNLIPSLGCITVRVGVKYTLSNKNTFFFTNIYKKLYTNINTNTILSNTNTKYKY